MKNKIFYNNFFFDRKSIHLILIIAPIIVGLSYIFLQWFFTKNIKDSTFIILLFCANAFLLWGLLNIGKYVLKNSFEFFKFILIGKEIKEKRNMSDRFLKEIFNLKLMCISGVIYGSLIGLAPKVLGSWEGNKILLILLSIFLFSINFITGFSLYSLITYFVYSIRLGRLVKVGLWYRENISIIFLRNIAYEVAIIGSIYISVCITSIIFAKVLPMGKLIIGYCSFSAIIMISMFLIPEIPIRKKLFLEKKKALDEMNYRIQKEHNSFLDKNIEEINIIEFEKIDKLILYKKRINSLNIWPTNFKTIRTTIGIIIISIIPVGIQYLPEWIKSIM